MSELGNVATRIGQVATALQAAEGPLQRLSEGVRTSQPPSTGARDLVGGLYAIAEGLHEVARAIREADAGEPEVEEVDEDLAALRQGLTAPDDEEEGEEDDAGYFDTPDPDDEEDDD